MQSETAGESANHLSGPHEAVCEPAQRILIVTDAWHPQINGVVRTLERLSEELEAKGCVVEMLTPQGSRSIPLPSYADIRLALVTPWHIARCIRSARPDHIHIATEGPLGMLARRFCLRNGLSFTTSYHTRFPEYLSARAPVPERWSYAWLRRFHNAGSGTLVATPSLAAELAERGFLHVKPWTRGVDTKHYRPDRPQVLDLPRPIFLSVGRVAVEKNLPAFLDLDLPGSKLVVGDGPDLERLRTVYPNVSFVGAKTGEELADIYASADVFVFPSRTDTFGIVLLEALASGVPVAAYPVTGPIDVLGDGEGGALSEDLQKAALEAVGISREAARAKALRYSWAACADIFLEHARAAHCGNKPGNEIKPFA
ncbi:glycosyltransferase involved in cell wall biosynthesis [Mesorhizobium soli]|jgi:glycosyltransferase involved in cell wall biosynthesis|uniref:glycosyltransferase family 4 protein n=1 Tax=Pseudaminobacter soli (ex Li et al. 2025) TaxID=1295366 RepID=UPI00247557A9|nr:glycosyltransferase family 1 protein [Mesorhizobium soli]MDH6229866.1 glycosyltransferase involved in cell wall biosynthesis [Mesorhizobium soli]